MVLVLSGVIIRLIVCPTIEAGAVGGKAGELVAPQARVRASPRDTRAG